MSRKPILVFDTNILLLLANGIHVFEDIEEALETKPEYVIIKPVYRELSRLASDKNSLTGRKALLALETASKYCRIVDYELRENEKTDDAIVRFALENNAIVATNDKELRTRLRKLGIPEAYFREESRRIVVEGYYK